MTPTRLATAALASAALLAAAAAVPLSATAGPAQERTSTVSAPAPLPTLPTTGLNILLGNDDGWNALGIQAVKTALEAAGHHVTMAAPASNNSGVSARVAFGGKVEVIDHGNGQWSTAGSPVTSMMYGMEHLFLKQKGKKPDLVVSGTNIGANAGFDTNYSGTVGVATVASGAYDVPAIAISTDTTYGQDAQGAYTQTANYLVDMIKKGVPDLPRGQFLNINYPNLTGALTAPKGTVYTRNAQSSQASFSFAAPTDGTNDWSIVPGRSAEKPAPGTDLAELANGYVTVSVLDADRSMSATEVPDVARLIRKVNGQGEPVPAPVPAPKVQKLPKKVLASTKQWIKATATDGTKLTFTWKPAKGKTFTSKAKVSSGVVTFKAPKARGSYKVVVKAAGKKVRTGKVAVR